MLCVGILVLEDCSPSSSSVSASFFFLALLSSIGALSKMLLYLTFTHAPVPLLSSLFSEKMKISAAVLVALSLPFSAVAEWRPAQVQQKDANGNVIFQPPRVSFQTLQHADDCSRIQDHLKSTFSDIGILSITDIPGFAREKPETLEAFAKCVQSSVTDGVAEHTFADGTVRKTIATIDGSDLFLDSIALRPECKEFQQVSGAFRGTVAEVTRAVGQVLSNLIPEAGPLLKDVTGEQGYNLGDIITQGQHLEHFHAYSKREDSSTTPADNTIDWHTDQGLMLVFSPGLVQGQPSKRDFFVTLKDGTHAVMEFDNKDELVILLGDGVNQYVNNHPSNEQQLQLRAVPHALSMHTAEDARVWYGRMVLPPAQALHPKHKMTFDEIRRQLNAAADTMEESVVAATIGCASVNEYSARFLQGADEDSCDPDTAQWCWHRCMEFGDFPESSPDVCASRNLEVACANEADELWADFHADKSFGLRCVNMTSAVYAIAPDNATEDGANRGEVAVDGSDHSAHDDDNHSDHDNSANGDAESYLSAASTWMGSWNVLLGFLLVPYAVLNIAH